MGKNYLKLSFGIVIILIMLFAPLAFNIFSGENAYAMAGGGGGKNKGHRGVSYHTKDNKDENHGKAGEYTFTDKEDQEQYERNREGYVFVDDDNPAGVQTPEPATLLLLSGGAAGLVALRKRLKK